MMAKEAITFSKENEFLPVSKKVFCEKTNLSSGVKLITPALHDL
jgi:hypothetical protein